MAAKSISPAMRTSSFSSGLIIAPGPPPEPPELANLQHWIDITDPATVFSDTACTVQAGNGDTVECVTNKGFSTGHPILDFTIGTLTLATGLINGLQGLTAGAGSNFIVSPDDTEVGGASGHTIAFVARTTQSDPDIIDFEWSNDFFVIGGGSWVTRAKGPTNLNTTKATVQDEWVYVYGSYVDGDNNWRAAGASEQNNAESFTQQTGDNALAILLDVGDFVEGLIYNIGFDASQRTALISYFDSKYTTLPFVN